ncbi:hypothetical protein K9S39_37085 [Streptomyces halobius]|uniref:Lipoprotein n=2 Tax=Streptomyces halobius TaxID=2879846 RepID=A0ABY4MG15_9ACTN|nr:hypothetical protein K9S39_37085 [Streptomyces halobius]
MTVLEIFAAGARDGGKVAGEAGRAGNGPPFPGASRREMLAATAAAGLGLFTGCGKPSDRTDAAPRESPRGGRQPSAPSSEPGSAGASSSSGSAGPRAPADPPATSSPSAGPAKRRLELPRGGRELFPRHRLVGFCGLPGAAALGRLGVGAPARRAAELAKLADVHAAGREPLPVLELLAVVTVAEAGHDGTYRTRTPAATVRRFHALAREHRALLLLNIQPGRAAVLDEVAALREWLVHPDVGLALDPEWEMGPHDVPGRTFGRTSGDELTRVARYLSELVDAYGLPQKPLVFHQVATSVVRDESALRTQPGVALIKSVDGIGSPAMKRRTWRHLVAGLPDGLHTGFKLFYEEDAKAGRLMTPEEVLSLGPEPEYVMYE